MLCKSTLDDLKPQLKEQYKEILMNFLNNQKEGHIETIQNYGDNIILQIALNSQRTSLIIPIVELTEAEKPLIDIEAIRLQTHQHHQNEYKIQQQVENHTQDNKQMPEQQLKEENGGTKNQIDQEREQIQQNGLQYEYSQTILREKYKKMEQQKRNIERKYQILQQEHRQLTLQFKNMEQKYNGLLKKVDILQEQQKQDGKANYVLHKYKDYEKITKINDSKDYEKQQQIVRTGQVQNGYPANYQKYKNSYNNQFTDYYENSKNKKPSINAEGFTQYTFTHFSLGKYGNCFEIKDKNIIRFREADVFGNYYQMPSFDTIPLQGKTKVIFKLIKSKSNNIHVGILLTIRKRFRYSIHQQNLISYKLKGGKYALHQDGDPAKIDCQQIKPGQSLQMIVDRQANTIQFKKNLSIKRELPQRFKKADLFPFVTMKDIGDQIQIL